jgi:predicted ribosomally synthesized peptide with nif11-like leader
MSSPELSRLLEDLRKDPVLLNESRALRRNSEAALGWAAGRGYRLTLKDVMDLLDCDRELSDEDLDQAAGGDDAWPAP